MATFTLQEEVAASQQEPMRLSVTDESIRNWPNEAGFQTLHEERTPVELRIRGTIPAYAAGLLYRTGPGAHKVDRGDKGEFACTHWFDGFGHTHRFEIVAGEDGETKVFYNSRRANDKLIEKIKETGKYGSITFGQRKDPCIGIFGKMMSVFAPTKDKEISNAAVVLKPNMPGLASKTTNTPGHARQVQNLWATTDATTFKELDPLTLEPIGLANQKTLHPALKGPMSYAHAQTDPETGDVFNYNLALGLTATYRVFKTSTATGKTEILATISTQGLKPAYLHSFFKTEDFIVLCVWSAHLDGTGIKIVTEQNIVDAIAPFNPTNTTKWFVVDRKQGKGLVAEFESPAAFCFHTVNAWQVEKDGRMDIVCEFAEYENLDIIHALYYTNLTSNGKNVLTFLEKAAESALPSMVRYRLRNIGKSTLVKAKGQSIPKAQKMMAIPKRQSGDLPTMNPRFAMRESRYNYSIVNRGYSTFFDGIAKVDMQTQESTYWANPKGHTPGEAIFVPNPGGVDEDDGVLLSVVLDGFQETSYLICLDARTMRELGRAECDWAVGFGFHGVHVG